MKHKERLTLLGKASDISKNPHLEAELDIEYMKKTIQKKKIQAFLISMVIAIFCGICFIGAIYLLLFIN